MLKESMNIMDKDMRSIEERHDELWDKFVQQEKRVEYLKVLTFDLVRIINDNGAYQFDSPEEVIEFYNRNHDSDD